MVTDESRDIKKKLYVLNYVKEVGDVKKACRYFGIARSTFYEWKNQHKNGGIDCLARKKTGYVNHPKRTPKPIRVNLRVFLEVTGSNSISFVYRMYSI